MNQITQSYKLPVVACLALLCLLSLPYSGAAQICSNIGGANLSTITENFDSLGNSPAPKNTETTKLINYSALPPNNPPATRFLGRFDNTLNDLSQTVNLPWAEIEEGPSSTTVSGRYNVGDGISNAGNTYSFASTAAPLDRALGSLTNDNAARNLLGACFTNTTGGLVSTVYINYTGEQWRNGGRGTADRFDFQYAVDTTASNNIFTANGGAFTDFNTLSFVSPVVGATASALDGNAAPNRQIFPSTAVAVAIPANSTLYIRWVDTKNGSGANDDGLALDDFSISLLAPTRADVSVAGRVTSGKGAGLSNAIVVLTGMNGQSRTARTGALGYFNFEDVTAGETYLISISSKRYTFAAQVIAVNEDLTDLTFMPQ